MRKFLATVAGVLLSASVLVSGPSQASNIGEEGCTPGYWKTHTENWKENDTLTYSPNKLVSSAFAVSPAFANTTFLQALQFQGGSGLTGAEQILLRAAVAAWLNAAHEDVGYPYRRESGVFPIVPKVNEAIASGNRATMLDVAAVLDAANNLGCTLS